ncbi:hypothetical protein ACIBI4_02625 [Streptomyces sp. NPDC050418]|uniref:hypothetical protein n=1 Tax=Streptomyces sp. NPDC050418 TaxID=3365612 RepID=UPI00378A5B97
MTATRNQAVHTVEQLMDLLYACRDVRYSPGGGAPTLPHEMDLHDHALQTAALLRRSHPADKQLQVAGLVHALGRLLRPGGDETARAVHAAEVVRPLLGRRVADLVRLHATAMATDRSPDSAEDVSALRHAEDAARAAQLNAGVLEDWRPVLALVAAAHGERGAHGAAV